MLDLPHATLLASMLLLGAAIAARADAQTEKGPYARIAMLRPRDGDTVDFEAGYVRHLEWHRQAKDPWTWYGWTVWAGERQRWFVYATFGRSAASLDHAVSPAEDEKDNVSNVTPHAQFTGSALYEFLPALSRGSGEPEPAPRVELTTVELVPGSERSFETALETARPKLQGETLWYRMVAGGTVPRYVRLRTWPSLSALVEGKGEQALPEEVRTATAKVTVEILNLRPAMSYNLPPRP